MSISFFPRASPSISPRQFPPPPLPSQVYTVEEGDTLWDIAQRHECTMTSILKLNGFSPKKADIFPGQTLKVPAKPPAPEPAPAAPAAPSATSKLVSQFSSRPEPVLSLPFDAPRPQPFLADPNSPIFLQFPYSVVTAFGSLLILASIPFLWIGRDRVAAAIAAAKAQAANWPAVRARLLAAVLYASEQWAVVAAAAAGAAAFFVAHVATLGERLSAWLARVTEPTETAAAVSGSRGGAGRGVDDADAEGAARGEEMECVVVAEGT